MIVRNVTDLGGDRVVEATNWISRRLLLAADGMGFSMHDTTIQAGTATRMCYQNHLEAVYCVGGRGYVEDLETGIRHTIEDGTIYALDRHDRHELVAESDLRMICVFSPALVGPETHDADGVYPLLKVESR